ncbi:hypothetical protein GEMRC1_005875 [Eukaryota sp. GEM-RC1]
MGNRTILELNLGLHSLTSTEAASLAEVFYSNNTLRTISFSSDYSINNKVSLILFTAISNNSNISKIHLNNLRIQCSSDLIPLFKSLSLRSITLPGGCLDSALFNGLENNSSIRELSVKFAYFKGEDLGKVLKFNTALRKLELIFCNVELSTIFKSLISNTSLLELSIVLPDVRSMTRQLSCY